jgi:trigger factor
MTEVPELDDDFAADISEFDTFKEYKDSIIKELTERVEKNNDIATENALVEKAAENAQMDIPGAMIDDQAEYMVREMAMRMSYQGLKMEDYLKYTGQTMEQARDMYRDQAKERVLTQLVLEAVRKAENIEAKDEERGKKVIDFVLANVKK